MVRTLSNYTIDFEGNLAFADSTRFRFSCDLKLSTNQVWQEFNLKLSARPAVWEVRSVAAAQTVQSPATKAMAGRSARSSSPTCKILRRSWPHWAIRRCRHRGRDGPWAAVLPAATVSLGWNGKRAPTRSQSATPKCGFYRLEARLLGRFRAVILVSLEGEILRVELPDDIVLTNDVLTSL